MAEKASKKSVATTILRQRLGVPPIIVATGFKLRPDKITGMIEVLLEGASQRNERVTLDTVVIKSNLGVLKQYVASLAFEQDDESQKEDVPSAESGKYANIIHVSQMGGRSETIFGVFSLTDWVQATSGDRRTAEVTSVDSVVAITSPGMQKKLVLELITTLSQHLTE